MRRRAVPVLLLCLLLGLSGFADASAAPEPAQPPAQELPALPFAPGEALTYSLSWSRILSAGTATLSVREEKSADGAELLRFISTARSVGLVDTFYRVEDNIQSLFDPRTMVPLTYTMRQRHGRRRKTRDMDFDHAAGTVIYHKGGTEEKVDIPPDAQDALSSLYVLRSQKSFTNSHPVVIHVHDGGKTWSVEIHVLGRERITVPVGTFDTIKLKTYPKYDGVFMNKGEIYIWLTDDARRIPVLMKSTITIGSIVATLVDLREGSWTP